MSIRTGIFCFLLGSLTISGFSQGYDADSVFLNDPGASSYFESFATGSLDNLPEWDEVITYKDLGWISLTLSIYHSRKEGDLRPCIVFFHGGGWETRALNQYKQYAFYFAGLGFVTMAAKYRVFNDSSSVTPYDEVEDAKSAIRYIRDHAGDLNIDPGRIIATGMSAGGHLAAATAYIEGFENQEEDITVSSAPDALMLQNAVIDLSGDGWEDGHDILGEDWKSLSPLQHIGPLCISIPSLVMSGSSDNLAPIGGMIKWDSAYRSLDCYNRLFIFPGRGHGFGNYTETRSGPGHRDFIMCLYFMENFLKDLRFCTDCPAAMPSEHINARVRIYPNPVHEICTLQSIEPIDRIILYSFTGGIEDILDLSGFSGSFDLNLPGSGVKLIRIFYESGRVESRCIMKL